MKHTIELNGERKTVEAKRTATIAEVAEIAFGWIASSDYSKIICHGSGKHADAAKAVSTDRPSDWMYHGMTCACRRIGPGRGPCDCGVVVRS